MEDDVELQDALETPEGEANTETEASSEITLDDALAERLAKAEEISRNQKIRAEKAEKELKKYKTQKQEQPAPAPLQGYSLTDLHAVSSLHRDDVKVVEKFAKDNNLSITEALNDKYLQAMISVNEQERKAAEAANTGKMPRGGTKIADEQILTEAYAGKEVDPKQLAEAAFNSRMKALQSKRR